MRTTLIDLWRSWGSTSVTRPMLICGQCPDGADAMAEGTAGVEATPFLADWQAPGRTAGFRHNQEMVDAALGLRAAGAQARCLAFLDLCRRPGCPQRDQHQLMSGFPGYFLHGTVQCAASEPWTPGSTSST
jgi:hypothetical protein